MAERGRPLFSIGAVSRMLDVAPATIRTWEARYNLVVPTRSEGGQRLFTREQVDQLRFVKDLIGRGRRPSEAHRLLAEQVANGGIGEAPKLRVLLAETQFGAVEMLRRLLGAEGFEVVLANDPAAAIARADEVALAVVDTDDSRFADLTRDLRRRGARVLPAQRLLSGAADLA